MKESTFSNSSNGILAILGLVLMLTGAAAAEAPKLKLAITEVSLGKAPSNAVTYSTVISADGKHLAYVAKYPNGKRVVVDGVEAKLYPDIPEVPLSEAGRPAEIRFSPDGRRVAYVASRDRQCFVVVDGVEGKPYDYIKVGGIIFSDDSKRVAYVARRDEQEVVIVDGIEGKPFQYISDLSSLFGGDGKTVTYIGVRTRGAERRSVLVVNGVETMDEEFINSSYPKFAGAPPAYVIKRGEKWHVIINGKLGPAYDQIGNNILFSRNRKNVLYRASRAMHDFIVLDGVEGKKRGAITENSYDFSPDGRVVYSMLDSRRRWVVIGDVENGPYDYVIGEVRFSEDGKHYGFVVERDGKRLAVIDGVEGMKFDDITFDIHFSNDGKRYFYGGKRDGKECAVIDGVLTPYDELSELVFSADGKHIAVSGRRGQIWITSVDGVERHPHNVRANGFTFSLDGNRFAYYGNAGDKQFVVIDGVQSQAYDRVGDLRFTPNGKHVIYTAARGDKVLVVADEVESKEYDGFLTNLQFEGEGFHVLGMRGSEYLQLRIRISE